MLGGILTTLLVKSRRRNDIEMISNCKGKGIPNASVIIPKGKVSTGHDQQGTSQSHIAQQSSLTRVIGKNTGGCLPLLGREKQQGTEQEAGFIWDFLGTEISRVGIGEILSSELSSPELELSGSRAERSVGFYVLSLSFIPYRQRKHF